MTRGSNWANYKATYEARRGCTRAEWEAMRRETLAEDGYACRACGGTERLEVDHIVALGDGGTNDRSNRRTLCRRCHALVTRAANGRRSRGRRDGVGGIES